MDGSAAVFLQNSTAVILCGGLSRRMHMPKHELFLDTITDQLADFKRVILSVRAMDQITATNFPIWEDEIKGCGPLSGLLTALRRSETPWIFLLPCDVPNITQALIYELYGHLRKKDSCLVPVIHGAVQPLVGIYHVSCAPELEHALKEKVYSVKAFLERLAVHYVHLDISWANVFLNVNTPEDYCLWRGGNQKNGV